ncbi:3-deoxy-7-phosphoheptulonate synthase [Candidatus Poribacteria bacterium]|nr:3-deoxy-7-phosphoheptulonate synthase [Candidatus Poribacteria bacterium]
MVIVMKAGATEGQIQHVVDRLRNFGLKEHISRGEERTLIGAIGDERVLRTIPINAAPGVEKVMAVVSPYKLASREFNSEDTLIDVNGIKIGGKKIAVMAGPCAVESQGQITTIAKAVKQGGGVILRGGAFKPRTGPYSFQGLGDKGLDMLAEAKTETGLSVITEIMGTEEVDLVASYTDIFQVGARNMQNFTLLKALGQTNTPVMLKRGMSATIEEFLLAAEYILSYGNHNVMLCERGIRTFETYTRNTLDINAVPVLKNLSHLPVIVDPSHATGRRELVAPMAKAAVAAGADGLIIEVHHEPENSLTGDGVQSLLPDQFEKLMKELQRIAKAVDRDMYI